MNCFLCKGDLEKSTTTYMTDYNNFYIIIKNMPCTKRTQCGEVYLNGVTVQKFEEVIKQLKAALEKGLTRKKLVPLATLPKFYAHKNVVY